MKSCKNICMIQDCPNKPEFYTNYSRYHKFCSSHLAMISSSDKTLSCFNCSNLIQCLKDLPLRLITDYKSSLKVSDPFENKEGLPASHLSSLPSYPASSPSLLSPLPSYPSFSPSLLSSPPSYPPSSPSLLTSPPSSLPIQRLNCSFRGCTSTKAKKNCDQHNLCHLHLLSKEAGVFCSLCRCIFCGSFGVTIKKCGSKSCSKDLFRLKCCYICCAPSSHSSPCGHFLCDLDRSKLCPCLPCEICQVASVKSRPCGHRVCETCEIQGFCTVCMMGNCESCSMFRPLYKFSCGFHSFCENCFWNKKFCELCRPNCFRCRNSWSVFESCQEHPLCFRCFDLFSPGFCPFCLNVEDFTCGECRFCFQEFDQSLNCEHRVCRNCAFLKCGHAECPDCFRKREICVKCLPRQFCVGCKKVEKVDEFSCSHGFCQSCGEKNNDEHFSCTTCASPEFWVNGKCLKCQDSFCNFCLKFKEIDSFGCGHKICQDCFKPNEKCRICQPFEMCFFCENVKQREIDSCEKHKICKTCREQLGNGCITCQGIDEEFRCSFCRFYYSKWNMKEFDCKHKACPGCMKANETKCELCDYCEVCLNYYKKQSISCRHVICEKCSAEHHTDQCIICNKSVLFCESCQVYRKPLKCLKGHLICMDCSQDFKEKFGNDCFFCDPLCYFCLKSNPVIRPTCKHLTCQACYAELSSPTSSCLLCDPSTIRCVTCKKICNPKEFLEPVCPHHRCLSCSMKEPCLKCEDLKIKQISLTSEKNLSQKEEFSENFLKIECFGLFCEDHLLSRCLTCDKKICMRNNQEKGKNLCFQCKNQDFQQVKDLNLEVSRNLNRKIEVLREIQENLQIKTQEIIKNIQQESLKIHKNLEKLISENFSLLKNLSSLKDSEFQQILSKTYVKCEMIPLNLSEISSFFNQTWFKEAELNSELEKSMRLERFKKAFKPFNTSALSGNSKYFSCELFEGIITVWELPNFSSFNLLGHEKKVTSLKFFHENLISSSEDGSILIWDLKRRNFEKLNFYSFGPVLGMGVSEKRNSLSFFTLDLKVRTFSFASREFIINKSIFNIPEKYLFTDDCDFFIISCKDSIKVFKLPDLQLLDVQPLEILTSVTSFSYNSLMKSLFVILSNGSLKVIDLKTLKTVNFRKIFENQIVSTFFDSEVFLTLTCNGMIKKYNIFTLKDLGNISIEIPEIQSGVFLSSTQISTLTKSNEIIVKDLQKLESCHKKSIKPKFSISENLRFSLLHISEDLFLFDLSSEKLTKMGKIKGTLKTSGFSSDSNSFFVCSDESCKVWTENFPETFEIKPKTRFDCAGLSDDSSLVAVAEGSDVFLWNVLKMQEILRFKTFLLMVSDLRFSRNNEVCIIAGDSGKVVVWNIGINQIWKSFQGSFGMANIFYVPEKQGIVAFGDVGFEVFWLGDELGLDEREEVLKIFKGRGNEGMNSIKS